MRVRVRPDLQPVAARRQPQVVAQLSQWVQFQGPIRRIESVGSMGGLSRKFVLITQNQGALWRGEIPSHGKGT